VIGCALAGAAAGVNLAAVCALSWLWYGGRRELRRIERGLALAAAVARAERAQETPQDKPPLRGA